jgi:hypothetical protein
MAYRENNLLPDIVHMRSQTVFFSHEAGNPSRQCPAYPHHNKLNSKTQENQLLKIK